MRLYSYVVARDYGFAPNPFGGVCTLCTCKPEIRRMAQTGDWVLGTGSVGKGQRGHAVFFMRVGESLTFDEYWDDPRFAVKKPALGASLSRAYGDNIYHRDGGGRWQQANSHHSLAQGALNQRNLAHDTRVNRVLIADDWVYWGREAIELPATFRSGDTSLLAVRGHRSRFSSAVVAQFADWAAHQPRGYLGEPADWR